MHSVVKVGNRLEWQLRCKKVCLKPHALLPLSTYLLPAPLLFLFLPILLLLPTLLHLSSLSGFVFRISAAIPACPLRSATCSYYITLEVEVTARSKELLRVTGACPPRAAAAPFCSMSLRAHNQQFFERRSAIKT